MLKLSRSVDELVAEAEETVISLTPTEVLDRLDEPGLLLIDLRDIRSLKGMGGFRVRYMCRVACSSSG